MIFVCGSCQAHGRGAEAPSRTLFMSGDGGLSVVQHGATRAQHTEKSMLAGKNGSLCLAVAPLRRRDVFVCVRVHARACAYAYVYLYLCYIKKEEGTGAKIL